MKMGGGEIEEWGLILAFGPGISFEGILARNLAVWAKLSTRLSIWKFRFPLCVAFRKVNGMICLCFLFLILTDSGICSSLRSLLPSLTGFLLLLQDSKWKKREIKVFFFPTTSSSHFQSSKWKKREIKVLFPLLLHHHRMKLWNMHGSSRRYSRSLTWHLHLFPETFNFIIEESRTNHESENKCQVIKRTARITIKFPILLCAKSRVLDCSSMLTNVPFGELVRLFFLLSFFSFFGKLLG